METNENEYPTRDMNLAACLMADGIKYLRVEKDLEDDRRLVFVFEAHPEIERIVQQRANANHIVSSTVYDEKLRTLKSIIHRVRQ